MESEVLGYQSPLFGRRTAQLKLEELTFFDAQPFYFKLLLRGSNQAILYAWGHSLLSFHDKI